MAHRIEGENVDDSGGYNLFRGTPPYTTVTPEWLNSQQEELMAVIEGAGLPVLDQANDTKDQLWTAVNGLRNAYSVVVSSQSEFEDIFSRTGANAYDIASAYTTVYLRFLSGGYDFSQVLSGGDTWGDISTNACTHLIFEKGAFILMGDQPGAVIAETEGGLLENVDIRGTNAAAATVTESFQLSAHHVSFLNCSTSNRYTDTDFTAFRESTTDAHNFTVKYYGCTMHNIQTDAGGCVRLFDAGQRSPVGSSVIDINGSLTPQKITGELQRMIGGLATDSWDTRTPAANKSWVSICWSPELSLFCAVADSGAVDDIMTSPDGITWTTRVPAANKLWYSICWSPELSLFCAVAASSSAADVMTSPDGITWTTRVPATNNSWRSVTWSPDLSLFCAIANSGAADDIMTSPDGITWTTRVPATNNSWVSICWSPELSLFCAVANSAAADDIMTSPDGITWTTRVPAANKSWRSVTWSPGLSLFCAVASNSTAADVMTSPDGINWTTHVPANNNAWFSVTWSPGLGVFCSVASASSANDVMTSSYLGKGAIV